MAAANVDGLVEQGKRALREGNKVEAQAFLMKAVELDQYHEDAWLWLSSAVDTEEEQRTCLDNVLIINPDNQQAHQMVAELNRAQSGASALNSPFADTAFSGDATDLFSSDDFDTFSDASFSADDDPFASGSTSASAASVFTESISDGPDPFSAGDADPFSAPAPQVAPPQPPMMPQRTDPLKRDIAPRPEESLEELGLFENEPAAQRGLLSGDDDDIYGDDDEYDDEPDEDRDAFYYLSLIPDDVRPTRLPGSNETVDRGVFVGLGVVAVLNVLALGGVIWQLIGLAG